MIWRLMEGGGIIKCRNKNNLEKKMKFEKEFANLLFRNAIIFIDSAIGYINRGLGDYVNMIQAIVNLQFAMELALKSSVVTNCGIRTILVGKQSAMSDTEIEELYATNKLKIREYDDIKNYTKGTACLYNFERKEYQYMEMFQKYRNSVLHSSYIFTEEEKQNVEKNIIYALIHILGILMSEETGIENRIFMQEYLNDSQYAILLNNPIYNQELHSFLKKEYEELYTCPYCSTKTMTIDYKCARCFNIFSDHNFFQYVNCGYCGADMVICDAANIEGNNNYIRGLCLNCGNDTTVYKCPKCGQYINAELFDNTRCHEGFCSIFRM